MCRQEIDLVESLCGFKRVITTLDKRSLLIVSHVGDVITHGMVMSVITILFISIHFILHARTRPHM